MATATVTSKGQLTVPSPVRKKLNLEEGDRVEFVELSDGRYELNVAKQTLSSLKGMFGKIEKVVSIDEMNDAIADAWAKK